MKEWIRNKILDVRKKTQGMSVQAKGAYILHYYWHYFLLAGMALGLLVLLIYHIFWGRRPTLFLCAAVNQEIDYQRDREVGAEFAAYAGVKKDRVIFDSDYNISYDDVQFPEANESSYEKFFLNWSVHKLDAVILTESFYRYCLRQGGDFSRVVPLTDEKVLEKLGLYADAKDPLFLAIPADSEHPKMGEAFLKYLNAE